MRIEDLQRHTELLNCTKRLRDRLDTGDNQCVLLLPRNTIRAYPADKTLPRDTYTWRSLAMEILDISWEVITDFLEDDRSVNGRHLAINQLLFDSENQCEIIKAPDGYTAIDLQNKIVPRLDLPVSPYKYPSL